MSLRPSEVRTTQGSVVDATFAAARHVTGGRRSARLDEVLRAGSVVGTPVVAHGLATAATNSDDPTAAGLTRSLKNASLVPTGACLPRGFDPDYCAYDGYYAIGVTLVSAVVGALVDAEVPTKLLNSLFGKMQNVLRELCYHPSTTPFDVWMGYEQKFSQLKTPREKHDAINKFTDLCKVLDESLTKTMSMEEMTLTQYRLEKSKTEELEAHISSDPTQADSLLQLLFGIDYVVEKRKHSYVVDGMYEGATHEKGYDKTWSEFVHEKEMTTNPSYRLRVLVENLLQLILLPGRALNHNIKTVAYSPFDTFGPYADMVLLVNDNSHEIKHKRLKDWLYVGAMAAWTLKNVARYMNEHAMMIASFFRVNAKNLRTGAPLMLDLESFARQCREDIADGPNPPPQPPAYEDFDARALAAERRMVDLRKRAEERDPAMEGVDYPPVYASAGDAPLSDLHSGAALGKMNS